MTKNIVSLSFPEYKNTQQSVYFENEIGTITDKQLIFTNSGVVLNCNEIAFVEMIKHKKNYRKTAITLSSLILILGIFSLSVVPYFIVFIAAIILPSPLLFFQKTAHYIKIVKCEIKQIIIPVCKEQQPQAKEFVQKIAIYRHFNPQIAD